MSMDPSLPEMPGEAVRAPRVDDADEFDVDWNAYEPTPAPPAAAPSPAGAPAESASFGGAEFDLFGDDPEDSSDAASGVDPRSNQAQQPRGVGGRSSSVVGAAPIWSDWSRYSSGGETYQLRVNRVGPTGKTETLGDFPAFASRLDIIRQFGPGTFLCIPIDQFGAELDLVNTPYVLEVPPDHIYFQEQRRLAPPGVAPAAAPSGYGGGHVTDGTYAYLQQKDEAALARDMADREDLRERESKLSQDRADTSASQFGMAAKTVDNYTNMVSTLMNQGATRSDAQARAEREWYNRSADRDREQTQAHSSLQSESFKSMVEQARLQASQSRDDLTARDSRMREERTERLEQARHEEARKDKQSRDERDRREARERTDRVEADRMRAEERERERAHTAAMSQLMMTRMEASNPMNSLMAVGAMLVPALALAEKFGLVDAFKERFVKGKEEEDATGWASVVKEAITQFGEVGKVMMTPAMQLEGDDDDDDELIERDDGLLQDADGSIFHPDTEEELTLEQARQWLADNGRGLPDDEIAAAEAEQAAAAAAAEAAIPDHVRAARAGHGDAYREVGGPAALAAMNREKYIPATGTAGNEPAPTEPNERQRTGLRAHPADVAKLPAKDQAMARKLMVKLVEGLRKHPQDKWQALTISAVKHAPKALGGYLTATTIRKAAEEAGADDVLINKYIGLLNSIEGPLAAIIKDIPRG
jgi:hypothetical protein